MSAAPREVMPDHGAGRVRPDSALRNGTGRIPLQLFVHLNLHENRFSEPVPQALRARFGKPVCPSHVLKAR
jgi:hypothetical protein